MATSKEPRRQTPNLNPSRLRSAALLQQVDEWIHQHYVPVEAEEDQALDGGSSLTLSTMEVLEREFGKSFDAGNLTALSHSINKQSLNWLGRTDRHQRSAAAARISRSTLAMDDDDRTGGHDPREIVAKARENLLSALDDLEDALSYVSPISSAIGGNHPPEKFGLPPYSELDDDVVRASIKVLRLAPAAPRVQSAHVEDATEALDNAGTKITTYLAQLGDVAAKKFAEELGKATGIGVVGLGVWAILGEKLLAAAQAALHWTEAIKLFM